MRQKLPVVLVAGLGGLFTVVNLASPEPWGSAPAPPQAWKALASSADGTKLVAAGSATHIIGPYNVLGPPAPIYISTNSGATWVKTSAPSNSWSFVACSADGVKLVAVTAPKSDGLREDGTEVSYGDGLIYTSPDLGVTWTRTSAPSNSWSSVSASSDGTRLVASALSDGRGARVKSGDGLIYVSKNSGSTWAPTTAPIDSWMSVASSADGASLVAVAELRWVWNETDPTNSYRIGDGRIYRSLDHGATWTRTSAPSNSWTSIACSADGAKLIAAATTGQEFNGTDWNSIGDGAIYRSLDSGATWTPTSTPNNEWVSVVSSADGTKLVAAGLYSRIYISANSGESWTATAGIGSAIASSADGNRLVAGDIFGRLMTFPYSGQWRMTRPPGSSENYFQSVASSADGTKLVATASPWGGDGLIYTSKSGAMWTATAAPSNYWASVASSADGTHLIAAALADPGDGLIYTSSDSGAIWTVTTAPRNHWISVASSADGARLVAVEEAHYIADHPFVLGSIYTSGNSGASWVKANAPSNQWTSVASSADGIRLVAAAREFGELPGLIYITTNSGATWTETGAPNEQWTCVATSADGAKMVAAAGLFRTGGIYTTSDSGGTWMRTSAPEDFWRSIASSGDGTKLVAVSSRGQIYSSIDSGATWIPAYAPAKANWLSVAMSTDGNNIVVVGSDSISTLRIDTPAPVPPLPPSPQLAIGLSGGTLGLSWLVPSTRFVLQQNSDLGSPGWVDVPAPPTLNLTNLHHQVTLTPSLGGSFYRLKQQ